MASGLARRVTRWAVRRTGLETLAEKAEVSKLLYAVGIKQGLGHLLGQFAYAAGLLLTVSAIADLLSLQVLSTVMALVVRFMPRLLAATGVLFGGILVATFLKRVLSNVDRGDSNLDSPAFAAQLAYYVVLIVAVTLAADQAGLQTGIVESLIKLVVGIGLAGVALAAGLGLRTTFQQLASRHYYERILQPGDRIEVGELSGTVLRFTATTLIIEHDGAEVVIPASELSRKALVIRKLEDL